MTSPEGTPTFERRGDRISWELHRAVAEKLLEDPEPILARVPENVRRIRANVSGDIPNELLDDWLRITVSVEETLRVIADPSRYGVEMRRCGPFQRALTPGERSAAISRVG